MEPIVTFRLSRMLKKNPDSPPLTTPGKSPETINQEIRPAPEIPGPTPPPRGTVRP